MTILLSRVGPCRATASSPSAHTVPRESQVKCQLDQAGPRLKVRRRNGAHLEMGQQRLQGPFWLPSRHLQAVPTGPGPCQVMALGVVGGGMRSFSHTPSPYPLPAADGPFPRGGAGLEAGSRSPGAGGWKVGSGPRVSVPSPPMLGPAQEMGLWGPRTGKQAIHHTGWLYVCVCVGGRCFLRKQEQGRCSLR